VWGRRSGVAVDSKPGTSSTANYTREQITFGDLTQTAERPPPQKRCELQQQQQQHRAICDTGRYIVNCTAGHLLVVGKHRTEGERTLQLRTE
jgi:hypothetical protein